MQTNSCPHGAATPAQPVQAPPNSSRDPLGSVGPLDAVAGHLFTAGLCLQAAADELNRPIPLTPVTATASLRQLQRMIEGANRLAGRLDGVRGHMARLEANWPAAFGALCQPCAAPDRDQTPAIADPTLAPMPSTPPTVGIDPATGRPRTARNDSPDDQDLDAMRSAAIALCAAIDRYRARRGAPA